MTKFNPENKETLTYGECLDPAMKITDPEDARQYKEAYIRWMMRVANKSYEEALSIANSNLGYYAGYGSNELRERVEKLFECKHPIFGSIAENGAPSMAQAFGAGVKMASKSKE